MADQDDPAQPAAPALPKWIAGHWLLQEPSYHLVYRYPFVWLLAAMLLGTQCGPLVRPAWLPVCFTLIPLSLAAAWLAYSKGRRFLAGAIAFLVAALFAATYDHAFQSSSEDGLSVSALRTSQPIAMRALVSSAAVWRPNPNHRAMDPASHAWVTQWGIACEAVRSGDQWVAVAANSTLTVEGRLEDIFPGDLIEVFGNYRRISSASNPGAFDFAQRAAEGGEFVRISADGRAQISLLESRSSYPLRRIRGRVVAAIDRNLRKWVTLDRAPLAAALVFGQRAQVDWEDQQELMATGTLHLLAISGMHVGIIAALIVFVCRFFTLRNTTEFMAIATICGLYAALAGGQPPVLRAVVLVGLFALARVWGRKTRLANFLSLAAMVLLLIHSSHLGNVGVHLSFLAVASIGVFALDRDFSTQRRSALQNVLEESYSRWYRYGLTVARSTTNAFKLSFWVWLITCPLVWSNFHIIAPIAIPLNVLIAAPLVVSLLSGLLCGLFGNIPLIGWIAGMITGGGLEMISWLVAAGKQVTLGHVWLPAPPTWWIVCFYAVTVLWLLVFGKQRRSLLGCVLVGWLLIGIGLFSFGQRGYFSANSLANSHDNSGELRCTFLDVGHGTSVIIEHPSGEVWLYDAGHLGAAERSHQDIAAALWDLPTARLDKLVISHADADHYNATLGLLERFNIATVVSTQRFWQSPAREVVAIREAIEASAIEQVQWNADSRGELKDIHGNIHWDIHWQVLHPDDSFDAESDNASSLCLLIEYAGKRLLLPGDLEGSGMLNLVSLPQRPCHVLMAPHHGSLSHDPSELLTWCRPEVVVISGNHRAARPEVLEQYARPETQLGITFRDGAIQIRIAKDGQLGAWRWADGQWVSL